MRVHRVELRLRPFGLGVAVTRLILSEDSEDEYYTMQLSELEKQLVISYRTALDDLDQYMEGEDE